MVQVHICIDYNVDLKTPEMIPGAFKGKVVLNTAHGERHELYDFRGTGGVDEAQALAMNWLAGNILEYSNPSCRPLKYLKVAEQLERG